MAGRGHALAADLLDGACETLLDRFAPSVHTLLLGLTRRDSLAGEDVNAEPPVVEVLDVDGATGERGDEVELALVEQIVTLAVEPRVGLLLDLEDDIARFYARRLVAVAAELDLGAAADTTVDVDVEDLPVDNGFLAVALLAPVLVLDELALAVAVGAHGLEALDHGAHLAHHHLHTLAVTPGAALDGALLAAEAGALGADDGPLEGQLGDLALVDVLEGDLVRVVDGARLGGAPVHAAAEHAAETAAAAEELRKQVLGSHAAAASATLKTGLAILVVDLALLGIREDLVRGRDLLELLLGLGVQLVLVYGMLDRMTPPRDSKPGEGKMRATETYQGGALAR